jgi:lysophospholipase L1-like esterase
MRLVTFGDSFTAGYGVSDSKKWAGHGAPDKFEDFYRRMNSWPRFLAEKLNVPFINMGMSNNFGNNDIYNLIKENLEELNEDDLIIIAFSFPYRNLTTANSDYRNIDKILSSHKRYYFNAFYPMFNDEIIENDLNLQNFIKPNYTFSMYLGEMEKKIKKPLFQNNSWYNNDSIDGSQHPNLDGYKHIAEFVYDSIKDKVNLL